MNYDNSHNITAGQTYINRETGAEATVTKYTKIDATRGDVRIEGRMTGIELRTFHNEYRLK